MAETITTSLRRVLPGVLMQVDPDTGVILSHRDVWDAIQNNKYLSIEGLTYVLRQVGAPYTSSSCMSCTLLVCTVSCWAAGWHCLGDGHLQALQHPAKLLHTCLQALTLLLAAHAGAGCAAHP
jgi:hypothetical protein